MRRSFLALVALAFFAQSPGCNALALPQFGFVEFRARAGGTTGHTLISYGEVLDEVGPRLRYRGTFGLYPASPFADTPLLLILFMPGRVGKDGERTSPLRAVYRRYLTKTAYVQFLHAVKNLRSSAPIYHFVFFNCNELAAIIARSLGLRSPPTFELPEHFVRDLIILNEVPDSADRNIPGRL